LELGQHLLVVRVGVVKKTGSYGWIVVWQLSISGGAMNGALSTPGGG
jgi:hypothetical protein